MCSEHCSCTVDGIDTLVGICKPYGPSDLLAWTFYFKTSPSVKQHRNPYPWPTTVYQDLGIFE